MSLINTENNNGSSNEKESTSSDENCQDRLRTSTPSLLSDLQLRSTEIGEIAEMPDYENLNTSAVLHYCKHKILRPYLRLLGVMGLRPTSSDDSEHSSCYCILVNFHTVQVTIFMCIGYILQFMACFRRDRGFCYKAKPPIEIIKSELNPSRIPMENDLCYGNAAFNYAIPSTLHLLGYLYTVYLFRIKENEQLQNLMERAFLLSSTPVNRGNQKRLVRILWLFIGLSGVWMLMALSTVTFMMVTQNIRFQWVEESPQKVKELLKIILVICTLWHDMVQGTIITSYCLQGQLLISHLTFLRAKLLQHSIPPIEWMKEISEFKTLLKYFNDELGPAVCIYTVINISWAFAGIVWLFKVDSINIHDSPATCIAIFNVILWISLSIVPFVQAARLTTTCSMIQNIGHEVRIRPYVYQGTSGQDLDTILLYTSSLKICARLYRVPITGRYLCMILTIAGVSVLTLGQCNAFS
ncbi:uncharacterized protein LOC127282233 isoform X2 [Leptopilina boulardi]|uniref:uncharacterized protein LOC127282233 isoform X2 n=1 Tax=Leptopilina boulardi TaxID=63433 RepID=UPI0021F4FE91|nr:uncharacterized protein LOC127282233 isoform X2 [Leptopilina boulardi]